MTDEGVREIQLNGKQLVFLFMAVTVMAVVVFLCGVMVGRGVPVRAGSFADTPPPPSVDPTAPTQPVTAAIVSDGRTPVTAQETLSYPSLLEGKNAPVETLRPVSEAAEVRESPVVTPPPVERPAPARSATSAPTPRAVEPRAAETRAAAPPVVPPAEPITRKPAAAAPKPAAAAAVADTSLAEPRGNGFVVQVAAVRQRGEATRIATRLAGKGYPAFVTTAGANFRVRVGKFGTRGEAERVATRLEREERVEPWITR